MALRKRCAICGRWTRRPQWHAPGLEENFPDVVIEVCNRCHNGRGRSGLTGRAYEVGMLKHHTVKSRPRVPRAEPERTWDLIQGTCDVLAEINRSIGRKLSDPSYERRAMLMERLGAAAARVFWLFGAASGGPLPSPIGPEPAKNRRWVKRHGSHAGRSPAHASLVQAGSIIRLMIRLSSSAARRYRSDPNHPFAERLALGEERTLEVLQHVSRHPLQMIQAAQAIAASPLAEPLVESFERLVDAMEVSSLAAIRASNEQEAGESMLSVLRAIAPSERAFIAFARELADGADPITSASRLLADLVEQVS